MRLISREDLGQVGKVSFVGKSFDSFVRLFSKFFQCFKYAYVVHILVFPYLIWFVCFIIHRAEAYSELCQTSKMELFVKMVND